LDKEPWKKEKPLRKGEMMTEVTATQEVCSNCGAKLVEREQIIPRFLWDSESPQTKIIKVCLYGCEQKKEL